MPTMQAIHADIRALPVAAIVSAADEPSLGSGAEGATITPAYDLAADFIIHTVGPVWQGGEQGEAELLYSCYRDCISIAEQHGISSIAFPVISTGSFDYPIREATKVAVAAVSAAVEGTKVIGEVIFCCDTKADLAHYRAVLMQPS